MPKPRKPAGEGGLRATAESRLIARAVREGWPVPPEAQADAVRVVRQIAADDEECGRTRIAAVQALIAMDAANQTDHWNEDKNRRLDAGLLTERHGIAPTVTERIVGQELPAPENQPENGDGSD